MFRIIKGPIVISVILTLGFGLLILAAIAGVQPQFGLNFPQMKQHFLHESILNIFQTLGIFFFGWFVMLSSFNATWIMIGKILGLFFSQSEHDKKKQNADHFVSAETPN